MQAIIPAVAFVCVLNQAPAPEPTIEAPIEVLAAPLCATAPAPCVWVGAEYLLWWRKPVCLKPILITVGPPGSGPDTPRIGLGGSRFEFQGASGVRPYAGFSVPGLSWLSFEAEGLLLQEVESEVGFRAGPNSPASFLAFQNPDTTNASRPFTIPGVVEGASSATGRSLLWGVEGSMVASWSSACGPLWLKTGVMLGGKYLDLQESIDIVNTQRLVADPSVTASGYSTFSTHNQFAGPQLGVRLGLIGKRWSLTSDSRLAIGETRLSRTIQGTPLVGTPVLPGLLPGPFLAEPSNVGAETHSNVSLVPDLSVKARCLVTDHIAVVLGYRLLYWNRQLCPGDQMDPRLNQTQLPGAGPTVGPRLPAKEFVHTDFFAQGLDVGFELSY